MDYGDLVLGYTDGDEVVMRSRNTINGNIVSIGVSGTGKTGNELEKLVQRVDSGDAIAVVLNWHNCKNPESMPIGLREKYFKLSKVIDGADHISVPMFTPQVNAFGRSETKEMVTSRICTILGESANLSVTQKSALYEAVDYIYLKGLYKTEGIAAIKTKLERLNTRTAYAAIAKLRGVLDYNIFVDGELEFEKPILEIDLNRLDRNTQLIAVTVLLEYFFSKASTGAYLDKHLVLFIDECHNLDFGRSSIIRTMLYETRKLGLELFLATPELPTGKDAISAILQAGTRMYFRQEDAKVRDVAKMIDPSRQDKWTLYLSELRRGEYVLCGTYELYGIEYSDPVILRAFKNFDENPESNTPET